MPAGVKEKQCTAVHARLQRGLCRAPTFLIPKLPRLAYLLCNALVSSCCGTVKDY